MNNIVQAKPESIYLKALNNVIEEPANSIERIIRGKISLNDTFNETFFMNFSKI